MANDKYARRSTVVSNTATLAVLVTSDFEGFEIGDTLTKESDIAEYFRSEMAERNGDWNADDDAIIAVVQRVPQPNVNVDEPADFNAEQAGWEWSDMTERTTYFAQQWEESVLEALEQSNSVQEDMTGRGVANALPDQRKAQDVDLAPGRFGVKLDENEAMRTALHAAAMAPIDSMKAPAKVLLASLSFAGITIAVDGMPSEWKSTFDGRPVPGSKPSADYLKKTGNKVLPKDTYTFAEYKVKPRGATTLISYDYWKSVVDQTAEAKAFGKTIDEVKLAMPGVKSKEAPKGDFKDMKWSNRQSIKRENEAGLNGMYRGMKNAVSAWFMMRDIATDPVLSKNIGVSFVVLKPGKDNTVDSVTPIRIWDKHVQNGPDRAYTVSAFSNLNLQKCLDAGGTYSDLIESTKTGEQEKDIEGAKPHTLDTALLALTDLAAFAMVRTHMVELLTAINSKPGKGEEDEGGFTPTANDAAWNLVMISRAFLPIMNKLEKNGRFDAIEEIRFAKDKAAADEAQAEQLARTGT